MEPFVDHYKVLQLDPGADFDVIQAVYRRLARKYHPDVAPGPEAAERMAAINAVGRVLRDAERRAAFDRARALRVSGWWEGNAVPPPAPSAGHTAPGGGAESARDRGRRPDGDGIWARRHDGAPGPPPGPASGTVLDFGRYAGWSLAQIARHDPEFLEWFERMPIARPYGREIDAVLRQVGRRDQPAAPKAPEAERRGLFRRR